MPKKTVKQTISKKPLKQATRPPIVTLMGHVDHGKTSLLDAIRKSKITEQEFGGITQHISAYQVEKNDKLITFVDTPGHEAFTKMRLRGSQVADTVILVIAGDDSVQPQTKEAISHIKAGKVPIIVAINKMDLPGANAEKVKTDLSKNDVLIEDWGGDVVCVETSAKTGQGIDNLLEMILLVAEMQELKINSDDKSEAVIIESRLDDKKGVVATMIVKKGVFEQGDDVIVGNIKGKIRAMTDFQGKRVKKAGPSMPVEILGLKEVPEVGEKLVKGVEIQEQIQDASDKRIESLQHKDTEGTETPPYAKATGGKQKITEPQKSKITGVTKETEAQKPEEEKPSTLKIILKADVKGTLEAIQASLVKINPERIEIVYSGVGNINESDVLLASATKAIILGFNIDVNNEIKSLAEAQKVKIRTYQIIYKLLEDVEQILQGVLEEPEEKLKGSQAEILQTFPLPSGDIVCGIKVICGSFKIGKKVKIFRKVPEKEIEKMALDAGVDVDEVKERQLDEEGRKEVFVGRIKKIKHRQEDVDAARVGKEYGVLFNKRFEGKKGDIIRG